jgi:putative hemolysin
VDVPLGVGLLGLVCLLALQALFSASEIGFLAISPARARNMRDAGSRTAGLILFLKRYRSLSLAALLLGITGTVYTAERLAADVSIGLLGAQIGPWVSIVVLSLLVLVFAEVTPISWAARNPVAAARVGAFPMAVVAILALPATLVMAAFALVVEWLLRNVAGAPPAYTEDELKTMIDEITDRGEYAPTEQRMLKGVLDFGDQTAAQVMVPRTDMACASIPTIATTYWGCCTRRTYCRTCAGARRTSRAASSRGRRWLCRRASRPTNSCDSCRRADGC